MPATACHGSPEPCPNTITRQSREPHWHRGGSPTSAVDTVRRPGPVSGRHGRTHGWGNDDAAAVMGRGLVATATTGAGLHSVEAVAKGPWGNRTECTLRSSTRKPTRHLLRQIDVRRTAPNVPDNNGIGASLSTSNALTRPALPIEPRSGVGCRRPILVRACSRVRATRKWSLRPRPRSIASLRQRRHRGDIHRALVRWRQTYSASGLVAVPGHAKENVT
jgi:hypothetical protein